VPIPSASVSFIFLLLGNLFLSPVKEGEEMVAVDDGADGDEEEEEEEDEEDVEDEEVDVSSPSLRFGRLLLTGTKLIVALSCPMLDTVYFRRSDSNVLPGNCWLNEYSASLTKVKVAMVGRWDRCG